MPRERRRSTTEDSSAGRNITFAKTVNAAAAGVQGLTANTAGTTTFGGAVGNNARLANVTTDAAGTTDLNGGAVNTTGNQTYNDDVILTANTTVDSSGAGTLTFAKTVNAAAAGVQTLTANTAGTTIFQGAVGNNARLASLTTDAAGTTAINGGVVNTSGNQTYNDDVILGATTTVDSSAGGNITFAKTVNAAAAGVQALTANTAGTTTFGGAVGSGARLASLTTDASGTTAINGGGVNTTGDQTYNDDVTLGADT